MTQSADLPDLLPCPFCGTQPVIDFDGTYHEIHCCNLDMSRKNKTELIAFWNTRTPAAGVVEILEGLKKKPPGNDASYFEWEQSIEPVYHWNAAIDAAIEAVKK